MTLVNETNTTVNYNISASGMADCGQIEVNGLADLPAYDNQQNVQVSFTPAGEDNAFTIVCENTQSTQVVQMALLVEVGEN